GDLLLVELLLRGFLLVELCVRDLLLLLFGLAVPLIGHRILRRGPGRDRLVERRLLLRGGLLLGLRAALARLRLLLLLGAAGVRCRLVRFRARLGRALEHDHDARRGLVGDQRALAADRLAAEHAAAAGAVIGRYARREVVGDAPLLLVRRHV